MEGIIYAGFFYIEINSLLCSEICDTSLMDIQQNDNKIFAPLKNKWLVNKPEEVVRQEYICRLVNIYGFSIEQMAQEIQVNNSQRAQGRARADIVVWRNAKDKMEQNSPIIVVECKAEHITIREDDYFQGYNYAAWAGADFFVTSNLKETRIFRVLKGKMPKRLEEIVDIPSANIVNNAKKVDELLRQTKAFTRDEFSKLLFKCHNIIRNNDKLSPEAAFDEISKILFIKIRYERENSEGQIFSKKRFEENRKNYESLNKEMGIKDAIPFYQQLFERTKEQFKNDDLFDASETLKIRENSFEAIVEELQIYNLSTTSDDVKGIAFEQFLGKTFRGELGQFFTPRTLVDFMTKVLDPEEGEVICDPCCGSGGFLIKAFEYVRAKIEQEIHREKERIKTLYYTDEYENLSDKEKEKTDAIVNNLFGILNAELDINHAESRLRRLSYDCIFGTDANPRMSRTAKMNMIMHGDGHGGVHHNDGLLNVNGIFDNRFDMILTNPPFGSRVEKSLLITEADRYNNRSRITEYADRYGDVYSKALGQVNDNIDKPLLSLYKTGIMSTLTEVLFIERCLNLLKPGGRMGIVLPEGVLNNTNLQKIREFVESAAKILLIVSIPQDVFIASGATVKPSLLFLKKFTEAEAEQYAIIKKQAEKEIAAQYETELAEIAQQISEKGKTADEKKALRAKQKAIEIKAEAEVKALVKARFTYDIPLAEVEKAGISTTGAEIENELEPLETEFTAYRKEKSLWNRKFSQTGYQITDNHKITRMLIAEEKSEVSHEKKKSKPEQTVDKKYLYLVPSSVLTLWDVKRYTEKARLNFGNNVFLRDILNPFVKTVSKEEMAENKWQIISKINFGGELFLRDFEEIYSYKGNLYLVPENAIIYSKINVRHGCLYFHGKGKKPFGVSSEYPTYTFDEAKINGHFLHQLLRCEQFKKILNTKTSGISKSRVKTDEFLNIPIPLPSLEEQTCLVENFHATIRQAEVFDKKADALEKEIENYLFAALGIERKEKHFTKTGKLYFVHFKDIQQWGVEKLLSTQKGISSKRYKTYIIGDLCKIGSGGTPSRSRKSYYCGKIPWIKTGEVQNNIIYDTEEKITEEAIEESSAKLYPAGSLIIAMYGQGQTRGRTAKLGVDATTNQACAVLYNINNDIILTDYLWLYLQNEYLRLRELASGNNQPNLNAGMIFNYEIQTPPLSIQAEITSHIHVLKEEIKTFRQHAGESREQAIKAFEKAIFI